MRRASTPTTSAAGEATGRLLAPLTAAVSAWRRSRMFHPVGSLFIATAEPCLATAEPCLPAAQSHAPELQLLASALGARLTGPALVRFSGALWKRARWPDVLGCALRFSADTNRITPLPDDQDLLLATIRRPWTMAFSLFRTRSGDYLANRYYGVSPFAVSAASPSFRVEWRLRAGPPSPSSKGLDRAARLEDCVARGSAVLVLELGRYPGCLRLPRESRFLPVVKVRLLRRADLDQEALRFNPFQDGRGATPVGFVHSARRAAYAASQAARPRTS